jgi:DNA repair protein RecN (Recombination protein N)
MLGLKTLGARRALRGDGAAGRTLIFDEVDAGIGGRVAEVVGERLRDLGRSFQVLCITHLPQIAALGTAQFRIAKAVRAGRTLTSVERLDEAARVEELARMMGGATVTAAGREGARELLERGRAPAPPALFERARKSGGESESRRGAKAKEGAR